MLVGACKSRRSHVAFLRGARANVHRTRPLGRLRGLGKASEPVWAKKSLSLGRIPVLEVRCVGVDNAHQGTRFPEIGCHVAGNSCIGLGSTT